MTGWGKRKDGQAYPKSNNKGIRSSRTNPVSDIHMKEKKELSVDDLPLQERWKIIKDLGMHIIKMPDKNGGFMEPIISVNTYSMDAPYLWVISKGMPKLQKNLWYLFHMDEGLTGIYEKKSDIYVGEKWERSGEGSYHTHGWSQSLQRGDHFSQETLDDMYLRAGGDTTDSNKRYIHGLDALRPICKNCGKERKLGEKGEAGLCIICSNLQQKS